MVRAGGFVFPWGDTGLLTPGPGCFGCNGLEELSQVGYITVRAAARYSKVQNIVKLYLYDFVTTRDGMETKTIPPHELLFCPCSAAAGGVWRRCLIRSSGSALGHLSRSLCHATFWILEAVGQGEIQIVSTGGQNMTKLSTFKIPAVNKRSHKRH